MFVQQFFVEGLAHGSYLLGGDATCAIIDPRRDVDVYLRAAEDMGMQITHVLATHLHADFVAGHMDLAKATGASIVAPAAGECAFDHVGVAGGDTIEIDDVTLEVRETPGHTPEHVSYVAIDHERGQEPVGVFCGDTLFVGDVGRPDLFPGMAEELGSQLFDSLHQKLLTLPDHTEVYPAHGAGSLCGRAIGSKRTSTIGYERRHNEALLITDRGEFIESLTTDMPAAPDHFSRCSAVNRQGPTVVDDLPKPEPLGPLAFERAASSDDALVLDVRPYDAFGGQHVPGAWHIDAGGNITTFAGWLLPPDKDILLVPGSPGQVADVCVGLRRVGLDRVVGHLEGGMFAWARAGLATQHVAQLSAAEVHQIVTGECGPAIVDVRTPGEFAGSHIEGAKHIPVPELRTRHSELDKSRATVVICGTGMRSSMAASILQQHGFDKLYNAAGGMAAYRALP